MGGERADGRAHREAVDAIQVGMTGGDAERDIATVGDLLADARTPLAETGVAQHLYACRAAIGANPVADIGKADFRIAPRIRAGDEVDVGNRFGKEQVRLFVDRLTQPGGQRVDRAVVALVTAIRASSIARRSAIRRSPGRAAVRETGGERFFGTVADHHHLVGGHRRGRGDLGEQEQAQSGHDHRLMSDPAACQAAASR